MAEAAESIRWVPLESNPEVMTKYSAGLGATKGEWVDVLALDEDSLATIPKPVCAVILLFPIKPKYDEERKTQDELIKEKGQTVAPDLFYMKQTVHNACGTIGVMHALANNTNEVQLKEASILDDFLKKVSEMTPLERAQELEKSPPIAQAHEQIASEGQTAPPSADEELITHFVAFVHKSGHLYELDGRREFPINRGPTSPETLLEDAAVVCRNYMSNDPNEYRFTVVALTTQ